jgi:hypothetical protein
MAEKLLFPWDLEKLAEAEEADPLHQEVLDDLLGKYPVLRGYKPPKKRTFRVIEEVVGEIRGRMKKSQVPWVLVASNSPRLLNTISVLVPAAMAATYRKKPMNVNADSLIEYFRAPPPMDDFMPDPVGEELRRARNAGLLVWQNFAERRQGTIKYSSRFADLLLKRLTHRRATLFLCTYMDQLTGDTGDKVLSAIEDTYGTTVTAAVKESAVFRSFQVIQKTPKFKAEAY